MKLFNSANLSAPLGLVESGGGRRWTTFPVRYGLIEAAGRRLLVDTGYGPRILRGPRSTALRAYAAVLRPRLLPFPARDVDAILLTHLHADHVARLLDFPRATILASRVAVARFAAMTRADAIKHGIFPELLPADFAGRVDPVEQLPCIPTRTPLGDGYDLCGDGSHLAVRLPGHAPGHLGVFWREAEGPVLYATDVAWTAKALRVGTPRVARRAIFDDVVAGEATEARVRAFMADGGRVVLCHDPA